MGLDEMQVAAVVTETTPPSQEPRQVVHQSLSYQYSGYLPHPDMAKAYEGLRPGTFDEIVSEWKTESKHRRDLNRGEQRQRTLALVLPLLCGVFCVLSCLAVGVLLVYMGLGAAGVATILSPIIVTILGILKWKTPEKAPPA